MVFNKAKETTIFKPVTRIKNDIVYISKLTLNNTPLNVDMYYENPHLYGGYNLVHSEKIENNTKIERAYKLSKKGNYKLVYTTEGRQFTTFITY